MKSKNFINPQTPSDTLTVPMCYIQLWAFKLIKFVDSVVYAYKILVVYMLHSSYPYLIVYLVKNKIHVSSS